mmetsp:Transcript_11162/g.35600  ORF Transcript_11162/g.35600 Transcript_11162/m.35600 type:complete len:601 (+) Transcript_11162:1183-2985(+)
MSLASWKLVRAGRLERVRRAHQADLGNRHQLWRSRQAGHRRGGRDHSVGLAERQELALERGENVVDASLGGQKNIGRDIHLGSRAEELALRDTSNIRFAVAEGKLMRVERDAHVLERELEGVAEGRQGREGFGRARLLVGGLGDDGRRGEEAERGRVDVKGVLGEDVHAAVGNTGDHNANEHVTEVGLQVGTGIDREGQDDLGALDENALRDGEHLLDLDAAVGLEGEHDVDIDVLAVLENGGVELDDTVNGSANDDAVRVGHNADGVSGGHRVAQEAVGGGLRKSSTGAEVTTMLDDRVHLRVERNEGIHLRVDELGSDVALQQSTVRSGRGREDEVEPSVVVGEQVLNFAVVEVVCLGVVGSTLDEEAARGGVHGADDVADVKRILLGEVVDGTERGRADLARRGAVEALPATELVVVALDPDVVPGVVVPRLGLGVDALARDVVVVVRDVVQLVVLVPAARQIHPRAECSELAGADANGAHKGVLERGEDPALAILGGAAGLAPAVDNIDDRGPEVRVVGVVERVPPVALEDSLLGADEHAAVRLAHHALVAGDGLHDVDDVGGARAVDLLEQEEGGVERDLVGLAVVPLGGLVGAE